ncbi:MAG: DUF86 domain-containing protein [bacterium]|nr:DUF86 domain-containing protein [bacterium]
MRKIELYLKDILKALEDITEFVGNMTFEEFIADDKTSSAVFRKLEVIGEAAKGVPNDVRQKYPEVPWKEMAGMRDRLIHFYFGIDYELVWSTIKKRIPEIRPYIERIVCDNS